MDYIFRCHECGSSYSVDNEIWRCKCGGLLKLDREIDDFKIDMKDFSLWRYSHQLPIEKKEAMISLGEGMTPLLKRELAGGQVQLKLDFMMPTGSFKDRGAAVLVSKIKELGINEIVEDSSGNAGASIAAYAAAAGIDCQIYLPAQTSVGKIKQIQAYGAEVVKIEGSRDDVSDAIMEGAEESYYASHSWNPLFFEGTKTMAFEIYEQLSNQAPHVLVVPVGNGTMLLGVYEGFIDLWKTGKIKKLPRIIAVQSEKCAPIYRTYYGYEDIKIKSTVAEGISVGKPVRIKEIMEAIKVTEGEIVTVSDPEVIKGVEELAKMGIYVEPTSGTVIAGYCQALEKGLISTNDNIVLPLTGSGLKKK